MERITREESHYEPDVDEVEVREPVSRAAYDEDVVEERRSGWYYGSLSGRINSVLFAVAAMLEALLALRFMLVAFGANRTSGFVDFVMDVSWPFVRPFDNAFSKRTWDQGIIEPGTLLAMAVWLLAFVLIAMLISAVVPHVDDSGARVRRRRVSHM